MSDYSLSSGKHASPKEGRCAMEWVSFLAGEPHSDHPQCVDRLLTKLFMGLNDKLGYHQRQRLRPYLARTIGTYGDGLDEMRRWMCTDWIIRENMPAWLEVMPARIEDARFLRSLPPISTSNGVDKALERIKYYDRWSGDELMRVVGPVVPVSVMISAHTIIVDARRALSRRALGEGVTGIETKESITKQLEDSILKPGGLLDRMLPLEPVVIPECSEWREICFA